MTVHRDRLLNVATLNVRGVYQLTKRETLVNIMKMEQFEMRLLTETNVNSSIVECWDGFTAFFSTSIEPVIKEREGEKTREQAPHGSKRKHAQELPFGCRL